MFDLAILTVYRGLLRSTFDSLLLIAFKSEDSFPIAFHTYDRLVPGFSFKAATRYSESQRGKLKYPPVPENEPRGDSAGNS